MSSLDPSNQLSINAPGALSVGGVTDQHGARSFTASAEQTAATLVEISGASVATVDQYETGVPPNLASAASLVDQLTTGPAVSETAMGSLYTLMDPAAALALTLG